MKALRIGVSLMCAACAGSKSEPVMDAGDLAAIDGLHQADMAAAPAGDVDALMTLWSSDPIAMPPEGPLVEGREAVRAMLEAGRRKADSPWEPAEYAQQFTEVMVLGDYGWDLGTVTTRLVNRTEGTEVVVTGKLLRILKREPDGRWTVHRSMWSQEAPVIRPARQRP